MPIVIYLDVMLAKRKMTLLELSENINCNLASLNTLKQSKSNGIRFKTLEAICRVLACQPADILEYRDEGSYRKLFKHSETKKPIESCPMVPSESLGVA